MIALLLLVLGLYAPQPADYRAASEQHSSDQHDHGASSCLHSIERCGQESNKATDGGHAKQGVLHIATPFGNAVDPSPMSLLPLAQIGGQR